MFGTSTTDLHPRIRSCLRQFEGWNEADLSVRVLCMFGCERCQLLAKTMPVNAGRWVRSIASSPFRRWDTFPEIIANLWKS